MRRILVLAEGPTERIFIDSVLNPWLSGLGAHARAVIIETKRTPDGQVFRGGGVSFQRVVRQVERLLGDRDAALVTTLFDYYGFEIEADILRGPRTVDAIEDRLAERIQRPRFVPYLQLHEFEALVFSDPRTAADVMERADGGPAMRAVLRSVDGPEQINDDPATAPSSRLETIFGGYRKTLDGIRILRAVGLEPIRAVCPRFDGWLARIEAALARGP